MLPGAFMSQSFPSPVFSLLLTTRQDPGSMMEILKAIESGDWAFSPNERHPKSGKTIVGELCGDMWRFKEEAWNAFLTCMIKKGFDTKALEPGGYSLFQTARMTGNWDLVESFLKNGWGGNLEELSKEKADKRLAFWVEDLNYRSMDAVVQELMEGYPSLSGLSLKGWPLAVLPFRKQLKPNGAAIHNGTLDESKAIEDAFEKTSQLAKESLKHVSNPGFALWSWAIMTQAVQWLPTIEAGKSSPAAAERLARRCKTKCESLEKNLLRHLKKNGLAKDQAEMARLFSGQAMEDVLAMTQMASFSPRYVSRVSVVAVSALSLWGVRLGQDAETQRVSSAVLSTAFDLCAELLESLPSSFFGDANAPEEWKSGMYYALKPLVESQLRDAAPMPGFVSKPWSTIVPLLNDSPAFKEEHLDVARDWVLASDQVPPLSRLRAVMGSSVSILNGLEADRLELSFPTTVPSVRGPRL